MTDNLAEVVFRSLCPGFALVTVGQTYIVYPPPAAEQPLMYIADSLGAIARQIAEADNPSAADLAEDAPDPLPRRNHP
jgi:hypothetical protein